MLQLTKRKRPERSDLGVTARWCSAVASRVSHIGDLHTQARKTSLFLNLVNVSPVSVNAYCCVYVTLKGLGGVCHGGSQASY